MDGLDCQLSFILHILKYQLIGLQVLIVKIFVLEEVGHISLMFGSGLVDVLNVGDEYLLLSCFKAIIHWPASLHLELPQTHGDQLIERFNLGDILDLEHLRFIRIQIYLDLHSQIIFSF